MAVYFIAAPEQRLVKIGHVAKCPQQRVSSMQSGSPVPLVLKAVIDAREADLHQRFASLRERGEWFRLESPLSDFIDSLPAYVWRLRGCGRRRAA